MLKCSVLIVSCLRKEVSGRASLEHQKSFRSGSGVLASRITVVVVVTLLCNCSRLSIVSTQLIVLKEGKLLVKCLQMMTGKSLCIFDYEIIMD